LIRHSARPRQADAVVSLPLDAAEQPLYSRARLLRNHRCWLICDIAFQHVQQKCGTPGCCPLHHQGRNPEPRPPRCAAAALGAEGGSVGSGAGACRRSRGRRSGPAARLQVSITLCSTSVVFNLHTFQVGSSQSISDAGEGAVLCKLLASRRVVRVMLKSINVPGVILQIRLLGPTAACTGRHVDRLHEEPDGLFFGLLSNRNKNIAQT